MITVDAADRKGRYLLSADEETPLPVSDWRDHQLLDVPHQLPLVEGLVTVLPYSVSALFTFPISNLALILATMSSSYFLLLIMRKS